MEHHNDLMKLNELIRDIRVAMLVTQTPSGLRARPMYTMGAPEDGVLWFYTDVTTSKVAEVAARQEVLLAYASTSVNNYVYVRGRADIVRDPERAKRFWNIHAKAWFPGGPDDPNLALLRVEPEFGEYWDGPNKVAYTLSLLRAVATGGAPAGGHHESVRISGGP